MVWVWRDLKDHTVPKPLPCLGRFFSRPDCCYLLGWTKQDGACLCVSLLLSTVSEVKEINTLCIWAVVWWLPLVFRMCQFSHHSTWSWPLSGMGNSSLLQATCSSASPDSKKTFFLIFNLSCPLSILKPFLPLKPCPITYCPYKNLSKLAENIVKPLTFLKHSCIVFLDLNYKI